jgi:hypothetical protein
MKKVLLAAACFFFVYVALHLKNYFQVGHLFLVVKGDVFDKAFYYISFPGLIPTVLLIIAIFRNIHNYPLWFLETLSVFFNCAFYGYLFGKLLPTLYAKMKTKKRSV